MHHPANDSLPPPPPRTARRVAHRRRPRLRPLALLAMVVALVEIPIGGGQIVRVVRTERDSVAPFVTNHTATIRDLDESSIDVILTGIFGNQFTPNTSAGTKQIVVDAIIKTSGGNAAPEGVWTLHGAGGTPYVGSVTAARDMAGQEYFIVTFAVPQDTTVKRLTYDARLASRRTLIFEAQ